MKVLKKKKKINCEAQATRACEEILAYEGFALLAKRVYQPFVPLIIA